MPKPHCATTHTALAFAAVAMFMTAGARGSDSPIAYVIIGEDAPTGWTLRTADSAAQRYRDAGYTVIQLNRATLSQFQAALANPKGRALWYIGHGARSEGENYANISLRAPDPYNPANLIEQPVADHNIGGGPASQYREVVLHACYQSKGSNQETWQSRFPNATIYGWQSRTYFWHIGQWEYWSHTIPAPGSPSLSPNMADRTLDPRVSPDGAPFRDVPVLDGPGGGPAIARMHTAAFNGWLMSGTLLSDFGTDRTFNIFLTGDDQPTQWLFSGRVLEGELHAGEFDAPIDAPSFNLTLSNLDLVRLGDNRDAWFDLLNEGGLNAQVFAPDLSALTAIQGVGSLLLGHYDARPVPAPGIGGILALALIGARARRRAARPPGCVTVPRDDDRPACS
ncbi:MAG: hypothetical protein JNK35_03665 [Phycisphaerae bacterium]|nr:hypothetical protein [Phycisphaerae bacterium]